MTDERRALVDRYIAAYNAFDVDGMLSTLHPDVQFRNVAGGEVTASASGREAFRALAERSAALFSSRTQTITRFHLDGDDAAAADIDYVGVLAADLPGGPRAGDELRLRGRTEFGFRDGAIDRITDHS